MRFVVGIVGVWVRSALVTFSHIRENIIVPLQSSGYAVDVLIHDIDVGNTLLDGCISHRTAHSQDFGAKMVSVVAQKIIDERVDLMCAQLRRLNKTSCHFREARFPYTSLQTRNALRQLQSENELGIMIAEYEKRQKRRAEGAVVIRADMYPLAPLKV